MKLILTIGLSIFFLLQPCFSDEWEYDDKGFVSREKVHSLFEIPGGFNSLNHLNINDETGIGITVIEAADKIYFYQTTDNGITWDSINEFNLYDEIYLKQKHPPVIIDIKVNSLGNFLITTTPYTFLGEPQPTDSGTVFYSNDAGKTIHYEQISNELYGTSSIILINDVFYVKANKKNIDNYSTSYWFKSDQNLTDFELHSFTDENEIVGSNYNYFYSDDTILEMILMPTETLNPYKLSKYHLNAKQRDIIFEHKDRFRSVVISEENIFNVLVENTNVGDSVNNEAIIVGTYDGGTTWDTLYKDLKVHLNSNSPLHAYYDSYKFSNDIFCFWSGSMISRMLITLDRGINWYHFTTKVPIYTKIEVFDTTKAYMYGGFSRKEIIIWEIFPETANSVKSLSVSEGFGLLYPNPINSGESTNVYLPEGYNKLSYKIIDMRGVIRDEKIINGNIGDLQISTQNLQPGTYIISLELDEIKYNSLKLVVQ